MTEKVVFNDGFLDKKIQIIVEKTRNNNKNVYDLIDKYNSLCYSLEKGFEKEKANVIDLYLCTCFTEIHTSFQSYIILLERGLYIDSQIILRSIYDKVFNSLFIIQDSNNFNVLFKKNINENIKMCNYIKEKGLYTYMNEELLNNRLKAQKELEETINISKSYVSAKYICENMGLEELYIHYMLLSDYTHNGFNVIESKIQKDGNGVIINQNFEFGNFLDEIAKVIGCMSYVIKNLCEYLKNEKMLKQFESIEDQLVELEKSES